MAELGWAAPTAIQAEAIPLALEGRDLLARARTGSGKTGAYGLSLLQHLLRVKEVSGRRGGCCGVPGLWGVWGVGWGHRGVSGDGRVLRDVQAGVGAVGHTAPVGALPGAGAAPPCPGSDGAGGWAQAPSAVAQAVRALVLVPSKELGQQVVRSLRQLAAFCARDVRVADLCAQSDLAAQR